MIDNTSLFSDDIIINNSPFVQHTLCTTDRLLQISRISPGSVMQRHKSSLEVVGLAFLIVHGFGSI